MDEILKQKGLVHIDDWLDETMKKELVKDSMEAYLYKFFEWARLPAVDQNRVRATFENEHKLFCTYEGKPYRVTGASRLGDIWLAEDLNRTRGYDLRVYINQCSDWRKQPEL